MRLNVLWVVSLVLILVLAWPGLVLANVNLGEFHFETTPSEFIDGPGCDRVSYGGFQDSGSLLLLGGGECWMGTFDIGSYDRLGVSFNGLPVGVGALQSADSSIRVLIIRASNNSVADIAGPFNVRTGYNLTFSSVQGIGQFYVMFEHYSTGVSWHIDDLFVSAYDAPTPTPTSVPPTATAVPSGTPAATNTPAATVTATPVPSATPVPTATPIPWGDWLLPPDDLWDSAHDLRDDVVGREPFATVRRIQNQRQYLEERIQTPQGFDFSRYPSGAQSVFAAFIDFLQPIKTYIQIAFDAFIVAMFWNYVTKRVTT